MRVYAISGSPFVRRVQLVLGEKKLSWENVWLEIQKGDLRSTAHLARSPHGKVPAFEDGVVSLYESTPIVEYLEERHPAPPLLPADAAERALVRIEELEATIYFFEAFRPLAAQLFFTPEADRDAAAVSAGRASVTAILDGLERRASGRGGDFVMGPFSRADLTWLPFVEIARRVGLPDDPSRAPWTSAWLARMKERTSYEGAYPPHWRR